MAAGATAGAALGAFAFDDPFTPADVMEPAALAARLRASGAMPMILFVGFPVIYRSTRIPGAILAGPGMKPEGMQSLKTAVAKTAKNREIVLYCGCCPWTQCPNIRPAFKLMKDLGYTNVKVLSLPTNLATDWVSKGYPTEKAAGTSGL
jgi:thiosulfate/3-mercaptopyruvate sulfurtransferase